MAMKCCANTRCVMRLAISPCCQSRAAPPRLSGMACQMIALNIGRGAKISIPVARREFPKTQKAAAGGLFFCPVPTCHPYNCSACTGLKSPAMDMLGTLPPKGTAAQRGAGVYGPPCVSERSGHMTAPSFPQTNTKKIINPHFYPLTLSAMFAILRSSTEPTTLKGGSHAQKKSIPSCPSQVPSLA